MNKPALYYVSICSLATSLLVNEEYESGNMYHRSVKRFAHNFWHRSSIQTQSIQMRRLLPSLLFFGCFALLVFAAGCTHVFARQISTKGMIVEVLPATSDWEKGHAQAVSADGQTVWMDYYPKNGTKQSDWKNAVWTKGTGIRLAKRSGRRTKTADEKSRLDEWIKLHKDEVVSKLGFAGKEANEVSVSAQSITSDGSLVVGGGIWRRYKPEYVSIERSFLWREDIGVVLLKDVVQKAGIALPEKLYKEEQEELPHVFGISADGTTIVGGDGIVWRIYNPEGFSKNGKLLGIDSGELQLTGIVKTTSSAKWVLSVTSITTPNGKTANLSPARDKVILIPSTVKTVVGVKAGAAVIVTGSDTGKGKPLTARFIKGL